MTPKRVLSDRETQCVGLAAIEQALVQIFSRLGEWRPDQASPALGKPGASRKRAIH